MLFKGLIDKVTATSVAPIPTPALSQPRPTAPTPKRFSAIAGSKATAPPKSTATRSREIAPNKTGLFLMNFKPSLRL